MAYTYEYTGVGSPSSVLRNDGKEFPQHPANAEYVQWIEDGGDSITDPAPTISIETRRTNGKATIARAAASAAALLTNATPRNDLVSAQRFKEAQDYERFETDDTNDAAYVLLGAEVDEEDEDRDTVDKVHGLVLAEQLTLTTALARIGEYVIALNLLIDGCDTQGEIDAVIAGADFSAVPGELDLRPAHIELTLPQPHLRRKEPDVFAVGAAAASEVDSIELPLPAGDLEGMVIIAVVLSYDDLIGDETIANDDADPAWSVVTTLTSNQRVLTILKADFNDIVATPVVFSNGGVNGMIGRLVAMKNTSAAGVDHSTIQATSASATVTAPDFTPAEDHSGVLMIVGASAAAALRTASGYSGTNPDFVEVFDAGANIAPLVTNYSLAAAFDRMAPAGATGARTATLSGSAQTNFGVMLSFEPA